jgi:endonuclease III-like uncharacterized protein
MNKGYYHEAADRLSVMQNNIDENLTKHKAFKKKKYQKKLEKVQGILWELYQIMGSKM